MWNEEEKYKALKFVEEELPKRAVLDPEVGYEEEVEGIVHDADVAFHHPDPAVRANYGDKVFTGQLDTEGNKVYFTFEEIKEAAEA